MSTLLTDSPAAEPRTAVHLRVAGSRAFKTIWAAIAALVAERALRRAQAELMALDDRMLKDMGLDRSEVGSVLTDHAMERIDRMRPLAGA